MNQIVACDIIVMICDWSNTHIRVHLHGSACSIYTSIHSYTMHTCNHRSDSGSEGGLVDGAKSMSDHNNELNYTCICQP